MKLGEESADPGPTSLMFLRSEVCFQPLRVIDRRRLIELLRKKKLYHGETTV